MAANKVCSGCGKIVASDDLGGRKFCSECGQLLIEQTEAKPPKKVTFFGAIKSFFRGYIDFKGKSTRREYWYMYLFNALLVTIGYLMMMPAIIESITYSELSALSIILMFIAAMFFLAYGLGTLVPWIALVVRRMRDAGFNVWLSLLMFVPYAGPMIIFIFMLFDSKTQENV